MVKADAKRNYYADLELSSTADTEEIKKQFRKLARLYHPDRNPGKELEYVPKFQAIQAAHEILGDPDQRAKYDADRRKLGYGASGLRSTATAGATNFANSPYATYSNWPPPPRRTQPAQQPPRPPNYGPPPSAGAARAARFQHQAPPPPPPPPPRAQPGPRGFAKDDSEARRNAFAAWEHLRPHHGPTDQTWSDDEFRRGRAARDAANAHASKPGLGRSSTTKAPKKTGFDPNAQGGGDWEPQATRTSAYASYNSRPMSRPTPSHTQTSTDPPTRERVNPFRSARATPKPDGLDAFRSRGGDDAPFTEGTRISTPYAQHSGEKTYFSTDYPKRSASVRDPTGGARSGTNTPSKTSPRGTTPRHRSLSPSGRGTGAPNQQRRASAAHTHSRTKSSSARAPFDAPFIEIDSSSSDDSETSQKHMHGMSANSRTRAKAKPGKFWTQTGSPLHQTSGAETAPEASNRTSSGPSMYAKKVSFSIPTPQNVPKWGERKPSEWFSSWPFGNVKGGSSTTKPPYWAVPSSVPPATFGSPSNFAGFKTSAEPQIPVPKHTKREPIVYRSLISSLSQLGIIADPHVIDRFQFPKPSDGTHANTPETKSRSSENVTTSFSAHEWDGKFEGSKDFVAPPAAVRKSSKPRSPTRVRPPLRPGTAEPLGSKSNPIELADGFKVPPPPPNPPSNGVKMPPTTSGNTQSGSVKFSPEEWTKTIKEQTLFYPNPESSRSTSPTRPNTSAARKTTKFTRGRKQSKTDAKPTNGLHQATVSSDASDEDSAVPIPKSKSAPDATGQPRADEEDLMEIDSDIPTNKPPRNVHVQPLRPEWREGASTGTIPSVHPIPSTVPNAPVPPPPPLASKPRKTRTQRGASVDLGTSLKDLKNVTPFAPSSDGLFGMHDLTGTLPFESKAASHLKTFSPQPLELPLPPKAPSPLPTQSRITDAQWRAYLGSWSFYFGSWNQFETRILKHFEARHRIASRFGTGIASTEATRLLGAMGEGANEEGLLSYAKGLEEDVRVRKHWDVASERHKAAVQGLIAMKERVKLTGLVA